MTTSPTDPPHHFCPPGRERLRLREAGKALKVAMIACMRKLVMILNVMLNNNEHWRVPVLQTA